MDFLHKNQSRIIGISRNKPCARLEGYVVTWFNKSLRNSKEAIALFKRDDCVSVLISAYQAVIAEIILLQKKAVSMWLVTEGYDYLELILFSDMFMEKMNITEKVNLMELALELDLEKSKIEYHNIFTINIMISIMLSSNYPPFVNDIKPLLRENSMGIAYYLVMYPDCASTYGTDIEPCVIIDFGQAHDLIKGYAKQFINDNK